MPKTFFFYDLETSGFSPKTDRIMQFAGQRTDEKLNKIGDPINILVRVNDDVLPSPSALMVTKISPQKTVEEGYTEAEFAKMCMEDFFTPDTIIVGYNNVRFDDEHMRYLFWRNFYDPYEWQWRDGRSRWDLLDVVRMVRALRPEGINWPFIKNEKGEQVAANKLELLTKLNGISHENAHDALADVDGLIEITKLIKEKQPKIFDYLLSMRDKKKIQQLVNLDAPKPFVYTSGRLSAEFEKTTVAFPVAPAPNRNVIVWDLRYDPTPFVNLSSQEIMKNITATWEDRQKEDFQKIPVKILNYSRCPAVAPIGVLNEENLERLKLNKDQIAKNMHILLQNPQLCENLRTAFEERNNNYKHNFTDENNFTSAEFKLYDGFVNKSDSPKINAVRNSDLRQLADFHPDFTDDRLPELLLHYKARSFPKSLSAEEKNKWEEYRIEKIKSELDGFMKEMTEVTSRNDLSLEQEYIVEELKLWLENILPDHN